jgi:hypothetical protein
MKLRRYHVIAILFLHLSLASCGGSVDGEKVREEANTIHVKTNGKEVSFESTYARFATFKKGLILKDSDISNKDERIPAVVHRIYLSNYDLRLANSEKQDYRRIDSEGQRRVEIQIEAEQGAAEDARLRVGEYVYKSEPYDRISYVFLSYFKEGKDHNENLQTSEFGGKLKITSVTDTEVEGEIDVFDKNEFVKGHFKAQRLTK